MTNNHQPLNPRHPGGKLFVIVLGRISTAHQNQENIEASYRYVLNFLADLYQGEMDIRFLGEQGSGMRTDRATIREAEELIESGVVDLVIAEDLARIYRNPRHQYNFVQDAVDRGCRVICIGDSLDTADEHWEVAMGTAALRHGLFIPDTRRRVRRTATAAFHKGGMVLKCRFGYRKLTKEEADSEAFGPKGLRIAKLPECTATIHQMRRRVMRGTSCSAIADWLNGENVSPGSYVESGQWTGRLVTSLLRDSILYGQRTFRRTIYEPIFQTGKHKRKQNSSPEQEHYPELAHMKVEEFESLQRALNARIRKNRSDSSSAHPRRNVPRSRSYWPGQSAVCSICGGPMYVMGNHLRCKNSLKQYGKNCWNHVQAPIEIIRECVVEWLLEQFREISECYNTFVNGAWQAVQQSSRTMRQAESTVKELKMLERRAANLGRAIADGGELVTLVDQLAAIEQRIAETRNRIDVEEGRQDSRPFSSKNQIIEHIDQSLRISARSSFDFTDVMRQFFRELVIFPVQALDTGLVRSRAKLRLKSDSTIESNIDASTCVHGYNSERVFDLFEPPTHIKAVAIVKRLRSSPRNRKLSLRKMQDITGINYMTLKRATNYLRLMESIGTDDPYIELRERPTNASRWR